MISQTTRHLCSRTMASIMSFSYSRNLTLLSVFSSVLFMLITGSDGVTKTKRNVLFIVIDDLRPSLGCYGGPIISPNIDQLAAQSALFTNAMVQQAVCAPSRTSFLTGRRPDTTKLYDFGSYWREAAGNYTTLPQHFKENGYITLTVGKVFHPGATCGRSDDYPFSWTLPAYHSSTKKYNGAKVCPGEDGKLHNNVMCPVNVTDMPEGTLPDLQSLRTATNLLKILSSSSSSSSSASSSSTASPPSSPSLSSTSSSSSLSDAANLDESLRRLLRRSMASASSRDEPDNAHDDSKSVGEKRPPFFLAVGFRKPHIPWRYPEGFRSLYPLDSVQIADNPNIPEKMPSVAWEPYITLAERDDIKAMNLSFPYRTIPIKYHSRMRQSYYAAATYVDSLVGQLLQALEDEGYANNTIIALLGDHGWQLGEHGEWSKYSNYELATRAPLLIHVPGVTDTKWGARKKFSYIDALSASFKSTNSREKSPSLDNYDWGNEVISKSDPKSRSGRGRQRFSTLVKGGVVLDEFVELVDLFPSLAELASLQVPPVCPPNPFNVSFCSEGYSFAQLLRTKSAGVLQVKKHKIVRWKNATFSQYPRPGESPTRKTDLPPLADITIMGYSMRTRDYHYTEWIGFNHTTFEGYWTDVKARELYLNDEDPQQNENVVDEEQYADIVRTLSQQLHRGWRDSLPVFKEI